jgi:hypothetical protein
MSAQVSVQVEGIKETLQTLNKLDRELRKEFNRDAKEIVRPLTDNAKRNIPEVPLSGMLNPWNVRDGGQPTGRVRPGWKATKARNGIRLKIDTRKSKESAISVISKDPWAVIFDDAGKATDNKLARSLGAIYGSSPRALWRGVGRLRGPVTDELVKRVEQAERTVQAELKRES